MHFESHPVENHSSCKILVAIFLLTVLLVGSLSAEVHGLVIVTVTSNRAVLSRPLTVWLAQ